MSYMTNDDIIDYLSGTLGTCQFGGKRTYEKSRKFQLTHEISR